MRKYLVFLAYRFEKEQTKCRIDYWGNVYLPDGRCIRKHDYRYDPTTRRYESFENPEFKEAVQRVAYTKKTREYLRRRVWRTLKPLGEEGNPDYVKMAVGILLQYSDTDAMSAKQSSFHRYTWDGSRYNTQTWQVDWDSYAPYLTFNHILYENSPRYIFKPNNQAWRCRDSYKPGDLEPEVREEALS
jgi:hypothetical protein